MYLNSSTHQFTRLQNSNVLYNGKEIPFKDLPRTVIFQDYERGHRNKDGKELTTDEWEPVFSFIGYAERNGYPWPTIPPEEFFKEWEEKMTYYKYSEPVPCKRTVKQGITVDVNRMLHHISDFIKEYNLMTEKEMEATFAKWRNIIENHEKEETYYVREILKDRHGNKLIDWNQQTRQNDNNAYIRSFYSWLAQRL